jgi:hypothetical protein
MLFHKRHWPGMRDGTITLAFRRKQPRARVGARHRTPAGVIEIESVEEVLSKEIADEEARRAGFADHAAIFKALGGQERVYRVAFHWVGEDPRIALRERDDLSEEEWTALEQRLARLDSRGPWTSAVLRLIAERPGVPASELAESLGREMQPFKRDVRKLKELGLTESLERGYRLSPRGRALLERLG